MRDDLEKPDHTLICLWLDFYGPLLTERTREVLYLYYECDLSLAEIAENQMISRQAVHDKVRQGVKQLSDFECKLGLADRHQIIIEKLNQLKSTVRQHEYDDLLLQICRLEDLLST